MHRAFVDSNTLEHAQTGQDFKLDPETHKRFKRVLRLEDGLEVELFDGTGRLVTGILNQNGLTHIKISHQAPKDPRVTLYQAMVSMDKLEQIAQHATELGVAEIVLFKAERSQIDFKDKMPAKLERLTRIVQDAGRQCGRADVPKLRFSPSPLEGEGWGEGEIALICAPNAKLALPSPLIPLPQGEREIRIFIGPEGGFSPTEIEAFKFKGAQEICLGPYVLRTETASLAALAQIQGAYL